MVKLASVLQPLTPDFPMPCPVQKTLSLPRAAQILFAANIGALLFVLIMQYGFDLHPCVLCLWERVPYISAALLALLAWLWKPYGRQSQSTVILSLCAGIYLIGMGIAIFHTGVEQHWWMGTSGCAVEPLSGASVDDLRESLLRTVAPRCDEVTWTLFGLSMTNYNIAFSLALAFFAAGAAGMSRIRKP